MAVSTTTIFVDGENLSCRYHEMVKSGRTPKTSNITIGDFFVWNHSIINSHLWDTKRLNYYTSCAGDDLLIQEVRRKIAEIEYSFVYSESYVAVGEVHSHKSNGRIVPIVKKRKKKSVKESICDIAISVDVMRACYRDHSAYMWIISGDGDFLPLVHEVMHSGKQISVGALSSGLNPEMSIAPDDFMLLDDHFFEPEI